MSVPPVTRSKPRASSASASALAFLTTIFRVDPEFRLRRFAQADGLAGNDVHQRPALRAGEDGAVQFFGKFLVSREDHAAARAAQRLMRGGGDDVGIGNGAHVLAACDKARDMRHIDHEKRAVSVRNFGKGLEINGSGIGGRAGNEQLGPVPADHVLDLIIVDAARLRVHAVADAVIVLAGEIDAGAVRQMAAAGKIHAHERIARLQKRGVDRQIGLRAGVRLHIGIGRAEQLFGAFDRNRLPARPHNRSRRNSACRGSPRRICSSERSPWLQ